MNKTTNDRFKEIRLNQGLSQAKFDETLELKIGSSNNIEMGKGRVTPEIAKKIEDVFNINLRWLLYGENDKEVSSPKLRVSKDYKSFPKLNKTFKYIDKLKEKHKLNLSEIAICEIVTYIHNYEEYDYDPDSIDLKSEYKFTDAYEMKIHDLCILAINIISTEKKFNSKD